VIGVSSRSPCGHLRDEPAQPVGERDPRGRARPVEHPADCVELGVSGLQVRAQPDDPLPVAREAGPSRYELAARLDEFVPLSAEFCPGIREREAVPVALLRGALGFLERVQPVGLCVRNLRFEEVPAG
jgi:hypothetical protein